MSNIEYGLDPEPLEEFNQLISHVLIPEIINIADKYNYNRNSMVKYTANIISAMSDLATFENWKGNEDD